MIAEKSKSKRLRLGRPIAGHESYQGDTFVGRLGLEIRRLRERAGLSIVEASDMTDGTVSVSSWSCYERGHTEPMVSRLIAVCKVLDAQPGDLISRALDLTAIRA